VGRAVGRGRSVGVADGRAVGAACIGLKGFCVGDGKDFWDGRG